MARPVIEIDKPHFVVRLHEGLLEVDLKDGTKKELESMVEKHPVLRESLGVLVQSIIPLDLSLAEIQSVKVDDKGRVKIVTRFRKDLVIPLDADESQGLVDKLNELIPLAKQKEEETVKAMAEAEKRSRDRPGEPMV